MLFISLRLDLSFPFFYSSVFGSQTSIWSFHDHPEPLSWNPKVSWLNIRQFRRPSHLRLFRESRQPSVHCRRVRQIGTSHVESLCRIVHHGFFQGSRTYSQSLPTCLSRHSDDVKTWRHHWYVSVMMPQTHRDMRYNRSIVCSWTSVVIQWNLSKVGSHQSGIAKIYPLYDIVGIPN